MTERPSDNQRQPYIHDLLRQHVDASQAAGAESFPEAPVLVKLDEVPVGGALHVTATGPDGQPEESIFVRTGTDLYRQPWSVRHITPNGDFLDEPAVLDGSYLGDSGATLFGEVRRNAQLSFAVTHRARGKSGEEIANQGGKDWFLVPDVSTIDPMIVEVNLKIGKMDRLPDGSLVWNFPLTLERMTTGLVTDAWVVLPEAESQAQQQ